MANEFVALKDQATSLRKAERYSEELNLYARLRAEYATQCNEWEHWGYAQCLRKLGRSAEALEVCQKFHPVYPAFEQLRNLYAWCLYDVGIRQPENQVDEQKLLRAAVTIVQICKQEKFSAFEATIFGVVEYLKDKNNPPYRDMLTWLDRLDPELLSTEERPNNAPDARQRTFPSNREKYYALRTRALLETEQFELGIQTVNAAQQALTKFHPLYDVWFYWYRAKCALGLHRPADAITDLETMLKKNKHDYFIYEEFAEAYAQQDQLDKALEYAFQAALPKGELKFKWKLFC